MTTLFKSQTGRLKNGWKALAFISVSISIPLFFSLLGLHLTNTSQETWFLFGSVLLVSFGFSRLEGEAMASLGWRMDWRWATEFLVGSLGGVALILLATGTAMGLGTVQFRFSGQGSMPLLNGAWWFLGVAAFEETLSRGYLFQRLVRGMGFWPTQALVALCFAMGHWGNPGMDGATKAWATLNLALASVLLGLCWQRNRSMALPIGLHFGWNWAMGSLLGFGVSGTQVQGWLQPTFLGRPEWMSGGAFGLEGGLPGLLALIVGSWLIMRRRKAPATNA